jgi:two-component system chemotaxis response regulator CheB
MDGRMDDERSGVDALALVASAGGMGALTIVLRSLPADTPVAVVVQQHLSSHGSALVRILRQRTDHEIAWAADGAALVAGRVTVCPPGKRMEVQPDGTCALFDYEPGLRMMPHDALLKSMADAYGTRSVGVVLTGMGRDGAAGAAALKAAGGFLIAQSPDTADYDSMPRAAASSAHLVLPLGEIGPVLADMAYGDTDRAVLQHGHRRQR